MMSQGLQLQPGCNLFVTPVSSRIIQGLEPVGYKVAKVTRVVLNINAKCKIMITRCYFTCLKKFTALYVTLVTCNPTAISSRIIQGFVGVTKRLHFLKL